MLPHRDRLRLCQPTIADGHPQRRLRSISDVSGKSATKGSGHAPAQVVLGLSLLIGLIVLAILLARVILQAFSDLAPEVAAGLAIAFATVVVVPITRWYERRHLREQPLQTRKIEIYDRFIRGLLDSFFAQRRGQDPAKQMAQFFHDSTPDLAVWASDDVLARWSRLRRKFAADETRDQDTASDSARGLEKLFELEELFLAIRRDLGHSNKGLAEGDVLGLWVNDLDVELTRRIRSSSSARATRRTRPGRSDEQESASAS